MSFFKKLGKGLKSIGQKVLGVAGKVVSHIPIVGNIAKGISNIFSKKKNEQPLIRQGGDGAGQPPLQRGFSEDFRVPMPEYDIGWNMNDPRPRMRRRNYNDLF